MIDRDKRIVSSCGDVTPDAGTPLLPLPTRQQSKCDPPPPAVPVPRITPSPTSPDAAPAKTAETIDAASYALTVTCADDYPGSELGPPYPQGASVTMIEGFRTSPFRFQLVDSLPVSRREYAASLMEQDKPAVVAALDAGASAVAALLKISFDVATDIVAAYEAARTLATDLARGTALAALSCRWGNAGITVSCIGTRPGDGVAATGPNNPITVAPNSFFSPNSQDEADAAANSAAVSDLVCVYPNTEVTVSCSDAGHPALDPGQPDVQTGGVMGEETLVSPGPEYPGITGRRRINRAVVAAGLVNSETSATDAQTRAEFLALAQLDCFYINEPSSVTCPATNGTLEGNWDTQDTGNFLDVPQAIAGSETSWADAKAQAEALASTLLDCVIKSEAITVTCDDLYDTAALTVTSELAGGDILLALNVVGSPVYTVTLPSGAVVLPDSSTQAAANAAAESIALSALECLICSPEVPGRCSTPSADTRPPLDELAFSTDRTMGVELAQVCGATPEEVVSVIDAVGLTPKEVDPENPTCTFGNVALTVSCDGAGATFDLGAWQGRPDVYNKWDQTSVTIAAGAYLAATLEAANDSAIQVASVVLNCRYFATSTATCPDDPDTRGDYRTCNSFGEFIIDPKPAPIWRTEDGDTTDVPPSISASAESYVSMAEADSLASLSATAALSCPYTNYAMVSPANPCRKGQTYRGSTTYSVDAGVYVSEWGSTAAANMMAEQAVVPSIECSDNISGLIDAVGGSVQGGGAKIGRICGLEDCDPKPGDSVTFDSVTLQEDTCYHLAVTCDGTTTKATIEVGTAASAGGSNATTVRVDLGCYLDGETTQEALGAIQIDWCPDDGGEPHAFRMSVSADGTTWKVGSEYSSITRDDTKANLPVAGLGDPLTGVGNVYIQVVITSGAIGTASVVVSTPSLDEVVFSPSDPADQIFANLFVGRMEGTPGAFVPKQAIRNATMLSRGFESSALVWHFVDFGTHPDAL